MIRKYVWDNEQKTFVERVRTISQHHFVQGDIAEYGGRRKFREYLKQSNSIELGHSDIKSSTEKWNQRKADFADKQKLARKLNVKAVEDVPVLESRDYEMSRVNQEVANRLYNRPAPDRKTLIQLTLRTAKEFGHRR